MVIQECMHTVLMEEYLRWLHRLADLLLSLWLLRTESCIFLLKGIVSCHASTKLQLCFKLLSRFSIVDYMTYSSRGGNWSCCVLRLAKTVRLGRLAGGSLGTIGVTSGYRGNTRHGRSRSFTIVLHSKQRSKVGIRINNVESYFTDN